jgi:hypothetical protein
VNTVGLKWVRKFQVSVPFAGRVRGVERIHESSTHSLTALSPPQVEVAPAQSEYWIIRKSVRTPGAPAVSFWTSTKSSPGGFVHPAKQRGPD